MGNKVRSGELRAVMLCQGGGAGRGWGRRISAKAALIWELQKRMPGASSSCSSWLRAALQTSLFKEVCRLGLPAARHGAGWPCRQPGARAPTPQCRLCPCSAPADNEPFQRAAPARPWQPCVQARQQGPAGCRQQAGGPQEPGPPPAKPGPSPTLAVPPRCYSSLRSWACRLLDINGLPPQARLGKRVEGQGFVQDANREF